MRIISGSKKGHTIFSHKDKDVRPLSDKNRETIFNLVYIDPPYNKNLVTRSIKNILKKNLINKDSILVIEEERKSKDILIPELKIERVKELGISKFSFYRLT